MLSSCAIVPSIEKTPSVTITLDLKFLVNFNCFSKSIMSLFLYLNLSALHSRIPSINDAWFNESLTIASLLSNKGSKRPPLASNAAAYKMVSSVPKKSEISFSSFL